MLLESLYLYTIVLQFGQVLGSLMQQNNHLCVCIFMNDSYISISLSSEPNEPDLYSSSGATLSFLSPQHFNVLNIIYIILSTWYTHPAMLIIGDIMMPTSMLSIAVPLKTAARLILMCKILQV